MTAFFKKWWPVGAAIFGVLLILLPRILPGSETQSAERGESVDPVYYSEMLEEKIQRLILRLEGIDEAAVLLTLDGTGEYVYAQNTSVSEQGRTGDYLVIRENGNDKTVLVSEIYPRIRGVAVVCTGGDTVQVQKKITELLSAALGISSGRITVSG